MQDRLKLAPLFVLVGLFNSVVALILWSSSQLSTRQCNSGIPTPETFVLAVRTLCDMYIIDIVTGGLTRSTLLATTWLGTLDRFIYQRQERAVGGNHPRNPYLLLLLFSGPSVWLIKDSLRATKTIVGYAFTTFTGISAQLPRCISSKIYKTAVKGTQKDKAIR